jgi:hypothetical protein
MGKGKLTGKFGENAESTPTIAVKQAGAKNPIRRPKASDRHPHVYEPSIMPMKTELVTQLSCPAVRFHSHLICRYRV